MILLHREKNYKMFPTLKDLRLGNTEVSECPVRSEIIRVLKTKLSEIDKDPLLPLIELNCVSTVYTFDPEDEGLNLQKIIIICNEISKSGWTLRLHRAPYQWSSTQYMIEIYSKPQVFPLVDSFHGWTAVKGFHPPKSFLYTSC